MRATHILALLPLAVLAACNGDGAGGGNPVIVPSPRVENGHSLEVSAGERHACVVTREGTAFCWGANESGQLGNGSTVGALRPVAVSGATSMSRITAGRAHTCAIENARAVCWGDNASGQLGDGSFDSRATPAPVPGPSNAPVNAPVMTVGAGDRHSCLYSGRSFFCWGSNDSGQLGINAIPSTTLALPVLRPDGIDFYADWTGAITVGARHACSIFEDASLWCWGDNSAGQLGVGKDIPQSAVPQRAAAAPIQQVAAGARHTCAIPGGSQVRAVLCWGANDAGQLGNGTTVDSVLPVVVPLPEKPVQVTAGTNHTCALIESGEAYCWGGNSRGQLGNGTRVDSSRPVMVAFNTSISVVATGKDFSCGLEASFRVYCWGANDSGQLGNGTTDDAASPTEVKFP